MKRPIYLDYHATTPVDPDVLQAMLPYFTEKFGNAMSGGYSLGWEANMAIDAARAHVARMIGAEDREIVFTSGATESIHTAILGTLEERGSRAHVITAATEHKCTLEVCARAEKQGHEVTILGVDDRGRIRLDELTRAIRPETALISLMHANNEIGTVHPVTEVGRIAREHGVLFHVDAAQTAGRHPIDVRAMNIDLLSISAHKLYGPKGVGALFIRQSQPRVHVAPYLVGGGQEHGLRGGTHNVPGIVGLGAACEIAMRVMDSERVRLSALRDRMIAALREFPAISLNGDPIERLCNNVNVTIDGFSSDRAVLALHDVAFSSGSACSFGSGDGSHVIKALGKPTRALSATLRFGLGRWTTVEDVDAVTTRLLTAIQRSQS